MFRFFSVRNSACLLTVVVSVVYSNPDLISLFGGGSGNSGHDFGHGHGWTNLHPTSHHGESSQLSAKYVQWHGLGPVTNDKGSKKGGIFGGLHGGLLSHLGLGGGGNDDHYGSSNGNKGSGGFGGGGGGGSGWGQQQQPMKMQMQGWGAPQQMSSQSGGWGMPMTTQSSGWGMPMTTPSSGWGMPEPMPEPKGWGAPKEKGKGEKGDKGESSEEESDEGWESKEKEKKKKNKDKKNKKKKDKKKKDKKSKDKKSKKNKKSKKSEMGWGKPQTVMTMGWAQPMQTQQMGWGGQQMQMQQQMGWGSQSGSKGQAAQNSKGWSAGGNDQKVQMSINIPVKSATFVQKLKPLFEIPKISFTGLTRGNGWKRSTAVFENAPAIGFVHGTKATAVHLKGSAPWNSRKGKSAD